MGLSSSQHEKSDSHGNSFTFLYFLRSRQTQHFEHRLSPSLFST